eukprot:scaffold41353_cov91-Cyclotella_meneghiniana.AAC.1
MNALFRPPVIGLIRQTGGQRAYPSLLIHHDEKPQQGALFKMNTIRLLSINPPINEEDQSKSQLSNHQKAKHLLTKYGPIFIGTYLSVYVTTLASLFGMLEYGLIDVNSLAVVRELFKYIPHLGISDGMTSEIMNTISAQMNAILPKEYTPIEENTQLKHLGMAWITVKFTEPLRLGVSCLLTPRVARLFGRHDDWRPV